MSERSELRSRREERMEMALKIRLGARLFPKTSFFNKLSSPNEFGKARNNLVFYRLGNIVIMSSQEK